MTVEQRTKSERRAELFRQWRELIEGRHEVPEELRTEMVELTHWLRNHKIDVEDFNE